ncbi:MAG: hypothetical protein GY940_17545 [bacterium]|nr:hypothetical protein [bacterium]
MSNEKQSLYWFDSTTGDIFFSREELPGKKGNLYLVVNREELFFGSFSLHSKKRVKDNNVLNIQGHFIPFKEDYINIIYTAEKGQEKRFFTWVGPMAVNDESYFYDEIPESLVFKGDPTVLKNYRLFVFERLSGFEIIYFTGDEFYSMFEKEEDRIVDKIILLARKFSIRDQIAIFTDIQIPGLQRLPDHYPVTVDQAGDADKYFFMPDYFTVKKKFSNISENKQMKSIKDIIQQWSRNLTVIAALLLLMVLVNGIGMVMLKSDNSTFKEKFDAIDKVDRRAEMIRFRLNKIKGKIKQYPDHMLYLKTVSESMDQDSTLVGYSLEDDGRIMIEGYSPDSLGLLTRLRQSKKFKEVRFKTTVTKNVHSQREKFEIEILLNEYKSTETKEG